ncbi:hypothetical protein MMC07_004432 [Pseudocyphellaria aurata]|nr:hypothetical protein [Pseudocyphellaria aurata]
MVKLVKEAIGLDDISSDDLWFRKGILKVRTNQSTWKNRTLDALKAYVIRMIAADAGGILRDTVEPGVLFQYFERRYSVHDAEDGFAWAARFIKFGHMTPGIKRLGPGPFWIKSFFVNLAVKTKLHLDRPREAGFDREDLLTYYDQFPWLGQYEVIVPRHFELKVLKPRRRSRKARVTLDPEKMTFGSLADQLDMDGISGGETGTTIAFVSTMIFHCLKEYNENVTKTTIKFEGPDHREVPYARIKRIAIQIRKDIREEFVAGEATHFETLSAGFKIWALAQKGYLLHWIWHQKIKVPVGVKPPKLPKTRRINSTNSVAVACLKSLPGQPYCVWLDNLFVSKNLMTYFREQGFGLRSETHLRA